MKWFEKAVGREKIIHLFDDDLELKNVFLDTVLCYDYKLDLVLYVFDLPTNFPEKWQKSAFNAIKIKGTIYQFTLDTIYSAYENIKKGEFQAEIVFCFISIHQDVQSCILLTIPCHKLSQILLISLKGLVENHIL